MKFLFSLFYALFYIGVGGSLYYILEILYRGYSHYSMFLCGGVIFYFISLFQGKYAKLLHLPTKMIICSLIITTTELIFGIIFNLFLHKHVWDYSSEYFHFQGQICLTFSILWFFLSLPVLFLDKKIRIFFHKSM